MRRRDVVAVCVLFGGLVGGLAWALSTQARWVRENKPLVVRPPAGAEAAVPHSEPAGGTAVVGTISEDTRASMAREREARKRALPGAKAGPQGIPRPPR